MLLSHEHVGSKIPAKINTYMLTRAELLINLCYEIPCKSDFDADFWPKNLTNFDLPLMKPHNRNNAKKCT